MKQEIQYTTAFEVTEDKPMKVLTLEDIINAKDLVTAPCEVPEWGGVVFVRPMTGKERDNFEIKAMEYNRTGNAAAIKNLKARFVVACTVDENGNNMFTEKHIDMLNTKSSNALNTIFKAIQEVSGFTEKEQEELEKN